MADFTTSQISTGQMSVPSPQRAVAQPQSAGVALAGLFGSSVEGYLANEAKEKAQEQTEAKNTYLAEFQQRQLNIADAVDSGQMSSAKARRLMRKQYSEALSDNPGLADEVRKAHEGIITTSGLGKIVADGTEAEKEKRRVMSLAANDGYITDDMTEEEQEEGLDRWQQRTRAVSDMEDATKKIGLARAKVGLARDQVGLQSARVSLSNAKAEATERQARLQAKRAIGSLASTVTGNFRAKAETIRSKVEAGTMTREEGLQTLQGEYMTIKSQGYQIGRQAGSEDVKYMMAPIDDMMEMTKGWLDGSVSSDIVENANKLAIGQETALLLDDDDARRLAATDQLVKDNIGTLVGETSATLTRLFKKNREPDTKPANVVDEDPQVKKDYLGALKVSINSIGSGIGDENRAESVTANVNNLLAGTAKYGQLVENPSELNDEVAFFASDEFGRASEKGIPLNTEAAAGAKRIIQTQVEQVVKPLLREEWENASSVLSSGIQSPRSKAGRGKQPKAVKRTDLVTPVFNGTGVTFVPMTDGVDPTLAKGAADRLNKRVAPVINRMVRANAHLEGNTNYAKQWQAYEELFLDGGDEEDAGED